MPPLPPRLPTGARPRPGGRAADPPPLGQRGPAEPGASWFQRLIDPPADGGEPLVRYGCKMATGSGKTVVMAMLIAWTFCNRGRRPADTGSREQAAAFALEASDAVVAYARNERLEFSIPYEYRGVPRAYFPDFLVRLVAGDRNR